MRRGVYVATEEAAGEAYCGEVRERRRDGATVPCGGEHVANKELVCAA